MENEILELKSIYFKYIELHEEYKQIEQEANRLESKRKSIKEILDQNREREISLINKIEEEHGIKLTADDLLEIIKQHG
jgi:diphthamide synthase subunit DPH2